MLLIAELTGSSGFFLFLVAGVTCWLLFRAHRMLGRRPRSEPAQVRVPRPKSAAHNYNAQAASELNNWEVRMHDLARELSAELDSKMGALQHLIRLADDRLARLDAASAQVAAPHKTQAATLAANKLDAFEPSVAAAQPARAKPRHDEVYALADAGHDAHAIASAVGSPIGEIELILSLRRNAWSQLSES